MLAAFLLASYALNGWRLNPLWALLDDDRRGAYIAGDAFGNEWVYAVCDGKQQQITVFENGRLGGVEALDALRAVRFSSRCEAPVADNPSLPAWQAELDRFQALTTAADASVEEILTAAREMPVSLLYLRPLSDWIRRDSANAAAFLDAVARQPVSVGRRSGAFQPLVLNGPTGPFRPTIINGPSGRLQPVAALPSMAPRPIATSWVVYRSGMTDVARLIGEALDTVKASDAAAGKVAFWARERTILQDGGLSKLASIEGIDDEARVALLQQLDAARPQERAELYSSLASHLVHDGRHGALLARQLGRLAPADAAVAVRQLLAQPEASAGFAEALLVKGQQAYRDADVQLDVFMTIASKLKHEANAPLLLSRHLREIPGIQGRLAAVHLLSLDEPGETAFALAVLRSVADLHPTSRAKVVYAVMESEQFRDRRVQQSCLLAIRLELGGADKLELLDAMLRHPALDDDLQPTIRAELG